MSLLKRYIILIICLFISALYFNFFQYPNGIVTGGLGGLGVIINNWFSVEPSVIILTISVCLLVFDYIFIGKREASGAILATFIYPFFVKITSGFNSFSTNLLITSIIIGILSGISTSIVYKIGFSNGGITILSELMAKYFNLRLSISSFIFNIIIILLGGFGKIIYSVIILFIHCLIINVIVKNK